METDSGEREGPTPSIIVGCWMHLMPNVDCQCSTLPVGCREIRARIERANRKSEFCQNFNLILQSCLSVCLAPLIHSFGLIGSKPNMVVVAELASCSSCSSSASFALIHWENNNRCRWWVACSLLLSLWLLAAFQWNRRRWSCCWIHSNLSGYRIDDEEIEKVGSFPVLYSIPGCYSETFLLSLSFGCCCCCCLSTESLGLRWKNITKFSDSITNIKILYMAGFQCKWIVGDEFLPKMNDKKAKVAVLNLLLLLPCCLRSRRWRHSGGQSFSFKRILIILTGIVSSHSCRLISRRFVVGGVCRVSVSYWWRRLALDL